MKTPVLFDNHLFSKWALFKLRIKRQKVFNFKVQYDDSHRLNLILSWGNLMILLFMSAFQGWIVVVWLFFRKNLCVSYCDIYCSLYWQSPPTYSYACVESFLLSGKLPVKYTCKFSINTQCSRDATPGWWVWRDIDIGQYQMVDFDSWMFVGSLKNLQKSIWKLMGISGFSHCALLV